MFVYVLISDKDMSQYVGMSENPDKRLNEHNAGKVKSTKSKIPWRIVHLESFENRIEARTREKYLKSAAGRRFRKNIMGD